jgi:transglutaminase-like putative cysteine protease
MNIDLDSQIRTLFEGIDESQRPVSLDEVQMGEIHEVQMGQVQTRPPESTPSPMWSKRRLLVGVLVVLMTGFTVLLVQRSLGPAVVATRSDLSAAAAPDDRDSAADSGARRVVLSPLVELPTWLTSRSDVEVFTVESPRADYWRITSLDVFDGRIWRSRGSFEEASGSLETDLPRDTQVLKVTQTFDIKSLGGVWLPMAYEPAEIVAGPPGVQFEYERQSGTLIVDRDRTDSDGLTYSVVSAVPERDLVAIEAAGNRVLDEIAERFLELPDDFSPRVAQLGEEITGTASTPYEKALALQDFFRDESLFSYDLGTSAGHSSARIEDFLFDERAGYAEQFAGTYAAMARAVGLPARVAVGFTTGEFDPSLNAYRVSGKHAHAWPEVWLDGIGWLRFEPTPGRGAPDDQIYTG